MRNYQLIVSAGNVIEASRLPLAPFAANPRQILIQRMPRQTYFVSKLPCRKLNFSLKQGSYTNIDKKNGLRNVDLRNYGDTSYFKFPGARFWALTEGNDLLHCAQLCVLFAAE